MRPPSFTAQRDTHTHDEGSASLPSPYSLSLSFSRARRDRPREAPALAYTGGRPSVLDREREKAKKSALMVKGRSSRGALNNTRGGVCKLGRKNELHCSNKGNSKGQGPRATFHKSTTQNGFLKVLTCTSPTFSDNCPSGLVQHAISCSPLSHLVPLNLFFLLSLDF